MCAILLVKTQAFASDFAPVVSAVASAAASACSSICEHENGGKNSGLGNNRASPPYSLKNDSKRTAPNRAFIRVSVASRLMAGHWHDTGINLRGSSVMGCGRWKNYGSDQSIAEIEVVGDRPRMLGHFQCKGAWSCDHCARLRVAQTRGWLRVELMPALEEKGLSASLVTFTLAHTYDEDWSMTVDHLLAAHTLADRRLAKVYKKAGSLGKLKSLEVTVGKNGLHAHLHELVSHDKNADLEELAYAMQVAWVKAVRDVGGHCNERGFDFKPDCINDYVAKLEASHELASHSTKTARMKGKSLAQLLDASAVGDTQAGEEWLRAQKALGGRMRFHAGSLPKKLGIVCPSSFEDEELDDVRKFRKEHEPDPVRIVYAQTEHLKATGTISDRAGLAIILRSARTGDAEKVLSVVSALCAEVDKIEDSKNIKYSVKAKCIDDDYVSRIIQVAHTRPLTPDEVEEYLRAKREKTT